MALFALSTDKTESMIGIRAADSCSLHSSIINRSWRIAGLSLVVLCVHYGTCVNAAFFSYLALRQSQFSPYPFNGIPQWIRKFLHGGSPHKYFTIHFTSFELNTVPQLYELRYISSEGDVI